ncbi:MAG: acetyl-CoA carboxylase carboxyl transferase subunit alpha/beta [Desulfovibrio sp.]|nr:MAG: acetyl-CoA carboxylase carboxyl transferase subunit alpha/beta [Desulfovibrio sp.]
MDIDKRILLLSERLQYIRDVFAEREIEEVNILAGKLAELTGNERSLNDADKTRILMSLEDLFVYLENKLERELTPMDKVRIVRHPFRICLKDILENVYDNYTEIGGQDEYSIDPSMLIARAYISRRTGKKVHHQPVMVIGQEKGHGQEFRNGGSVKPWGNAKALHYMKVAETENIPIHTYVFTPGAYPVEDYPGAAQQIARNLYEMAGLKSPIIAVTSEGGSGGAEAIGLADIRLMLSHGYYSVISPEGAAAIEGRVRQGQRAPAGMVEKCATGLKITAQDNLGFGYIDRVVQEPPMGARPDHYEFFKEFRREIIRATDEVVLDVKGINLFRAMALRKLKDRDGAPPDVESMYVRWSLASGARQRLLERRRDKYRSMAKQAFSDKRSRYTRAKDKAAHMGWSVFGFLRYDVWKRQQKRFSRIAEEMGAEVRFLFNKITSPLRKLKKYLLRSKELPQEAAQQLTQLSCWEEDDSCRNGSLRYVSPQAQEDRSVTCPNSDKHGCLDLWAPDLYGDFAGVCTNCGHHFPMEYQWYQHNIFDEDSIQEFNGDIESGDPLSFEGFGKRLEAAKEKMGVRSACMTFDARIQNVKVVTAMFMAGFRGGSVGAAEGEKFILAAERAGKRRVPFLAYVHGTAGIRIQEGTNGVIQMPRCTMAVRRYLDEGGLYLVLYDTNSYAGPVASFLGCSPYQFSVRSANLGFAGPGVIKETTGLDISPDYHKAYHALSRGHIQDIWDRREVRENMYQALLTMGGRNLYYR